MTDTEALKALVARRIPAALKRITDGHGLMRVPADDTDPDLVLADCLMALKALLGEQREAQPKGKVVMQEHVWDRDGERCINCGTKDWMPGEGCYPLAALAGKPVAWGIFGLFPKSGGWCLQAGQVYTDQASANAVYLSEYENSSTFMVMPLYSAPPLAESVGDVEGAAQLMTWLRDEVLSGHWNSHGGPWGCIPCDAYQKVDLFLRKHVGREGVKSHGDKK